MKREYSLVCDNFSSFCNTKKELAGILSYRIHKVDICRNQLIITVINRYFQMHLREPRVRGAPAAHARPGAGGRADDDVEVR